MVSLRYKYKDSDFDYRVRFCLASVLCRRFSKGFVCCAHKMAGGVQMESPGHVGPNAAHPWSWARVPFGLTQHKTSLENSWSFPSWVGEVSPDPFTL